MAVWKWFWALPVAKRLKAIEEYSELGSGFKIAMRDLDEWYEFCIRDNGPGIDPQFHERIFGMFQTLKPRDEVEGIEVPRRRIAGLRTGDVESHHAGIPVTKDIMVSGVDGSVFEKMTAPLVVKIVSRDIPHKTEIGGVKLNVTGDAADQFAEVRVERFVEGRRERKALAKVGPVTGSMNYAGNDDGNHPRQQPPVQDPDRDQVVHHPGVAAHRARP